MIVSNGCPGFQARMQGGGLMLNTHRFVGIDVSGDYLDVAFEGEDRVWRTGNDAGGLATLGRRLAGIDRPHVVCEATGRACWPVSLPGAKCR